ncbi:hypothetical protein Q5752_006143 [Cryptotrichosporon argae]
MLLLRLSIHSPLSALLRPSLNLGRCRALTAGPCPPSHLTTQLMPAASAAHVPVVSKSAPSTLPARPALPQGPSSPSRDRDTYGPPRRDLDSYRPLSPPPRASTYRPSPPRRRRSPLPARYRRYSSVSRSPSPPPTRRKSSRYRPSSPGHKSARSPSPSQRRPSRCSPSPRQNELENARDLLSRLSGPDAKRPASPSTASDLPPTKSRRTSPGPMPPRPSGRRGGGRSSGAGPSSRSSKASLVELDAPLWDQAAIKETYGEKQRVFIKKQWEENPKAPLANYLGGGSGGAQDLGDGGKGFNAVEGMVDGKKVFRSAPNAGESAQLSDGSVINYDRARQFMEYYCQRYKFGKPEVDFTQATTKRGRVQKSVNEWEAVMTVGGRRIGMGTAGSKKGAQIKCYLDVTQYLESCDGELWKEFTEFSKTDKSANIGMAPHLVFQMSENLLDEVQGLCSDIRLSHLYHNAPAAGAVAEQPTQAAAWSSGRRSFASEAELQRKSLALQDKLAVYETDPKLEKMRETRNSLPVYTKATEILAKIEVNDVTIVMAATGSGKTTQVPQLIFDDWTNRGDGAKCNIVCTQPRRLAAMSVAERVADERGEQLGDQVGYQVRFDTKPPQPNGSITFCTTGIFLKRMQSALGATANPESVRAMDQVTHVVVDEVHERDIDTDLLLVVLKRLLADRRARKLPLKVILMSATIDPTLFQSYFKDGRGNPAPVAEVPGRTFPVERRYLDDFLPNLRVPPRMGGWVFDDKKVAEYIARESSRDPATFVRTQGITGGELDVPYPLVALTIAHVLDNSDDGHVLVFLPGWDEIKKVADILLDSARFPLLNMRFSDSSKYSIHYLHSTIPAAEQREVFKKPPPGVRRIILATNIAETSITIPDVVYVVDAARVKEKRYDPDRHMSSLVSAWVGSSNLGQRAGRAGRHREGEYYGLLSKMRRDSLDPHQMVEMKRADLSNVVMHVKALNLGEVEDVLAETIEPPEPSRIVAAMQALRMLGAMDQHKNLTSLGRVLLQLPVDAAIGKLCLYGSFFRCLDSALTLAAVLTNRDPFLAPLPLKAEADAIKDSWSPLAFRSDPLAIVAAYNKWVVFEERKDYRSGTQFCSDNFLSKPTLLQIKQVKESLLQSLEQAGVIAVSAGGNVRRPARRGEVPVELRKNDNSLPLLAALIAMASAPNFAIRTSEKTCRTSQDKTVFIHASSVNSRRREVGGPEMANASFNPAEKRLYAFGEKSRNVPPGGNPNSAQTQLRNVTRLDPMTYMLFGAYDLVVTHRGLECDDWLPVTGNLHALDDIQRLKTLLDMCMLRVFEGVGKALVKGRDQRFVASRNAVSVRPGTSRIAEPETGMDDVGENESDDEADDDALAASGPTTSAGRLAAAIKPPRKVEPLSVDEIGELEMLTSDVVKVLDMYAHEREGTASALNSRPATPGGGGGGMYPPRNDVYRPPAQRRW